MKRGSFVFDGVASDTVKTIIQTRPLIEAPLRKAEQRSTYGVDGTIPFDEGAYDNTNMDLVMLIDGSNLIADRQRLYNLLDSRGVYKDFIPYFDPDKIYRVMLNDKIQFENQYHYGQKQALSAKFTVKPYKYLVANNPITITGTTGKVTNPTNYVSQPRIKVTGTGAVILKINGVDFNIKNASNTIIIDSERYSAYQEAANGVITPMNHQIASREYPIFKPGENTINVTGSVTQLYIEPKWRSLV
jgi:phage-related protein